MHIVSAFAAEGCKFTQIVKVDHYHHHTHQEELFINFIMEELQASAAGSARTNWLRTRFIR